MKRNYTIKSKPMTSTVILAALILFTCCLQIFVGAARILDRGAGDLHGAITTELPPTSYIEDPENSDATTTSDSGEVDDMCFRCYGELDIAKNLTIAQMKLVDKQRKLIRLKNEAAAAAAKAAQKFKRRQRAQNSTLQLPGQMATTSSTRRSLENQPIVVSSLRVARSADQRSNGVGQLNLGGDLNINGKPLGAKTFKDPTLKELKHKQEQQLNETCKALYEAQQCLNGISRECIGVLQFHSQEVYLKQWLGRLNCSPSNNPTLKLYQWIRKSIPNDQEPEKVPIPRPISSPEEIQKKFRDIMGGGGRTPIGVILKPTLTKSASQKFNSISESLGQQQQLPLDGPADSFSTKGRHLLSPNQAMVNLDRQPESQLLAMTSQLLLVPAFLILVVLFVTLTSRYIKQTIV